MADTVDPGHEVTSTDARPVTVVTEPVTDLSAWVPLLLDGHRVVLADQPGAVAMAREAFATDLVCLVRDVTDDESVEAAVRAATAKDDPPDARLVSAAESVLRRRLEGFRLDDDPLLDLTAPRLLVTALDREEAERAHPACSHASSWGGRVLLVARKDLNVGRSAALPGVELVSVRPAGARRVDELVRRGLAATQRRTAVARRRGGPSGLAAAQAHRVASGLDRRVVQPFGRRVDPYRLARGAKRSLGGTWDGLDVDLVVTSGESAQTTAWHVLRSHPDVPSRSQIVRGTMRALVREIILREAGPSRG